MQDHARGQAPQHCPVPRCVSTFLALTRLWSSLCSFAGMSRTGLCRAPPPPPSAFTPPPALGTSARTRILIISEYLPRGNLRTYIWNVNLPLPWRLRVAFAVDTSRALAYLHARKCLHRDLKGENLLITENERVKVRPALTLLLRPVWSLTGAAHRSATLALLASPLATRMRCVGYRAYPFCLPQHAPGLLLSNL